MKSGDIWLIASYLNVHCLVYHQSGYVDRKEQDYLLLRVLRLNRAFETHTTDQLLVHSVLWFAWPGMVCLGWDNVEAGK